VTKRARSWAHKAPSLLSLGHDAPSHCAIPGAPTWYLSCLMRFSDAGRVIPLAWNGTSGPLVSEVDPAGA
jgi:hypothetical protein